MKVYFVGAGPGAIDLITVRGAKLLSEAPVVLYAGSLVPQDLLSYCRQDATIHDTAALSLDQQMDEYKKAKERDLNVVRLHSGDPSIYGATGEQMRRLHQLEIEYEIVPGVSSFSAAAAQIGAELTKPNISQSVILTRVSGRASQVPESESLDSMAQHKASMCIFLSGPHLAEIVQTLLKHYPANTPIALIYRATWADERRHLSTLAAVLDEVKSADWALTTMLLVGDALDLQSGDDSQLYSAEYTHKFRKGVARV